MYVTQYWGSYGSKKKPAGHKHAVDAGSYLKNLSDQNHQDFFLYY